MSLIRQSHRDEEISNNTDPLLPVIAVAQDRPENFDIAPHRHFRAQVVYASEGVMRVSTQDATWIVPPQQAVWIPPGVSHAAVSLEPLAFRTLYIHPEASTSLFDHCCVLTVPPLLREMILHAVTLPTAYPPDGPEARFMAVLPDLLKSLKPEPLQLPLPRDRRLQIIADALMENPANAQSMMEWAQHVGASERTLARHFRHETGMSFNAWRQRLKVLHSIQLLSDGKPVTAVAYELGYESPSAFIAMFRRELGYPPRSYLKIRSDTRR